jgi:hypothetical protein
MSGILTRRSLLANAGSAAAFGAFAPKLISLAEAQEAPAGAAAPRLALDMIFPSVAKAKIDEKKFVNKHMPLLREVYGASVDRIEFRTLVGPPSGVPAASVLATSRLWIKDVPAFSAALAANNQAINLDLDGIARGPRIVQVNRLVGALGEELSEVQTGTQLLTVFFPVKDGETFDEQYLVDTHLPKLYAIYGRNAARRITALLGVDQGSKATYKATVTVYIRERGAYDSAARGALAEMVDDIKKFTNIPAPEFNELKIQGIV